MSVLDREYNQMVRERAKELGWTPVANRSEGLWLADEVARLRNQRDELVATIIEIGYWEVGYSGHGMMDWRDSKSDHWQQARELVEAVEEEWKLNPPEWDANDL
jgi:ubiquinone biosynthesis protein UbiJ